MSQLMLILLIISTFCFTVLVQYAMMRNDLASDGRLIGLHLLTYATIGCIMITGSS